MFQKLKSLLSPGPKEHAPLPADPPPPEPPVEPLPELPADDKPQPSPYDAQQIDTGEEVPEDVVTSLLDIETDGKRGDAIAMRLRFLRREPILDRAEQLVGYEFSLRNRHSLAEVPLDATVKLMNDQMLVKSILDLGAERLLQGKQAFIEVSPQILEHPMLENLPGRNVVVALQVDGGVSEELVARCRELKDRGFKFALDNPRNLSEQPALLQVADYVRYDISRFDAIELGKEVVAILKVAIRPFIAMGVDSEDHFDACRKLSFNYFEGYYFTRPQLSTVQRLDSQRLKVIELLNLVRNHAEIRELEASVKRDAAITYRILRWVNSPASGLLQEVRSIAHALAIMGYDQLYRWLTLLLFTSGKANIRSQTLLKNALVRARLVELLGRGKLPPQDHDGLFLVGILSLLEALLKVPLATALANFHLPQPVTQALLKGEGIYAPYLRLAIACEEFDQEEIQRLAASCGLNAGTVNAAHVEALVWAEEVEA